jgi:predicted transcriptional regulator
MKEEYYELTPKGKKVITLLEEIISILKSPTPAHEDKK